MVVIFYCYAVLICVLNHITDRKYERGMYIALGAAIFINCVFVKDDYTDWQAYKYIYEQSNGSISYTKDIGFGLLCYILNIFQFPAISLRVSVYGGGLILLYKTFRKFDVNAVFTLALYTIFPLTSDSIQIRNTVVVYLLTYAMGVLIVEKKPIKCFAIILLSALFHKMAVLYAPIAFLYKVTDRKSAMRTLLCITGILVLLLGWNKGFVSNIVSFLRTVDSGNIRLGNFSNLGYSTINYGWIIDWSIYGMLLFLSYICLRKTYTGSSNDIADKQSYIFWINIYAMIFLPFSLISFDYFRYIRNLYILNYIGMSMALSDYDNMSEKKLSFSNQQVLLWISIITFCILSNYLKIGFRGEIVEKEFFDYFLSKPFGGIF